MPMVSSRMLLPCNTPDVKHALTMSNFFTILTKSVSTKWLSVKVILKGWQVAVVV